LKTLNLFYQEPDPDRWVKFDRYPRKIIRRLIRGKEKPGSIMMIALGLMAGLDRLKIPYRFNDFRYIKKHPDEIACIIGKPHLLTEHKWANPIIFGSGIFSHPSDYPKLVDMHPSIKKILVPGPWMQKMFQEFHDKQFVISWPVGIDTEKWKPCVTQKTIDFLVYSKFLWNKEENKNQILYPILAKLRSLNLKYEVITYGTYTHKDLAQSLSRCKSAIFLCEHESQGMAYQQILSSDVPILAWDREDYWLDPSYYPQKIKFKPTSSVPYWDYRCGLKFQNIEEFESKLKIFTSERKKSLFSPRSFVLDNLSLEVCAQKYLNILSSVNEDIANS